MELLPLWMLVLFSYFSLVSGQNNTCPTQCECIFFSFTTTINIFCGSIIQQQDDVNATLTDILQKTENIGIQFEQYIVLSLIYNRIASIPTGIFQRWELKYVWFLDLNYNKLTNLTNGMFDGLEVVYLSLQFNEISHIEKNTFHSLTNLSYLDLENNLLVELPHDTFLGLKNLKELRLENNRLVDLHAATFSSTDSLELLILNDNELAGLPGNIFSSLDYLSEVSLHNNPWNCTCRHLFAYQQWMLSLPANMIQRYDLVCSDPPDQKLSKVDLNCSVSAPKISESDTTCKTRIYLGEKLELKCKATGVPDAKVSWNDSLTDDPDVDYDVRPVLGGEKATVTIKDFQARHEGLYTCWASNSAGEDIFNCRVSFIVRNTTTTVHSTSATTTVHSTSATTTVPSSATTTVHSTGATTAVLSGAISVPSTSATTTVSSTSTTTSYNKTTVMSNSTTTSYKKATVSKGPPSSNDQKIILLGLVIAALVLILITSIAYSLYVKRRKRKENELKEKMQTNTISEVDDTEWTNWQSLEETESSNTIESLPFDSHGMTKYDIS